MNTESESPTFSVIIRTQGSRDQSLREALESVRDQEFRASEVLVVRHDVPADRALRVAAIADEVLGGHVKLLDVPRGTRALPIAAGIREASSDYLLFLDDDDIALPNWLSSFATAIIRAGSPSLPRAQVLLQHMEESATDPRGYQEVGPQTREYASTFDLLDHVLVNRTPFMSMAFPRELFVSGVVSVDTTLTVCEDWDLVLQAATSLPVVDVPEATAVYRRWNHIETSYSRHDLAQWRAAEHQVRERLGSRDICLPGSSIQRLYSMLELEQELHALREDADSWRLAERSLSWKLTAPLRSVSAWISRLHRAR